MLSTRTTWISRNGSPITLKFKAVKNCGKVNTQFSNIDTDGARVSRDFLENLIVNVVKRSTDFYDETGIPGDHTFNYRERQFHSVVCPSIADMTASYVMENPLIRKPHGEEEFSGHVDYWINYRNYSFLMELKHSYFAYRRPEKLRSNIVKKFDGAMGQLKSIRKDQCRGLNVNKGTIKIALQAIVFYEASKKRLSRNSVRSRDVIESFNKLMGNLKRKLDISMQSLWILNERLVDPYEYENQKISEIYPAVAFIANISEMIE